MCNHYLTFLAVTYIQFKLYLSDLSAFERSFFLINTNTMSRTYQQLPSSHQLELTLPNNSLLSHRSSSDTIAHYLLAIAVLFDSANSYCYHVGEALQSKMLVEQRTSMHSEMKSRDFRGKARSSAPE